MAKRKPRPAEGSTHAGDYDFLLRDVVTMLESARHASPCAKPQVGIDGEPGDSIVLDIDCYKGVWSK